MSAETDHVEVKMSRLAAIGTEAAVAAVMDSAPDGPPEPLIESRDALRAALSSLRKEEG